MFMQNNASLLNKYNFKFDKGKRLCAKHTGAAIPVTKGEK